MAGWGGEVARKRLGWGAEGPKSVIGGRGIEKLVGLEGWRGCLRGD